MNNDGQDSLRENGGAGLSDADARALLSGSAPPAHAAEMPPRDAMLSAVCEPAVATRSSNPVIRRLLATAALAVVALVLFFAWQGWRGGHPQQQASPLLAPDTAWASVDGVVLEYELSFDGYFSGTALDPPDHPVWQLNKAVEQWSTAHGISSESSSTEPHVQLNLVEYNYGGKGRSPYIGLVQVTLLGLQEDMVDSLLEAFDSLEWLPLPKVYSESLYLSQKYPNSHYIGRKVIINGVEYIYPRDFTEDEARSLFFILRTSPEAKGNEYIAFLRIGSTEGFPLADVVRVQYGDPLNIDDYAENFDRSQLNLLSFEPTVSWVPGNEEAKNCNPLEMLAQIGEVDKLAFYRTHFLQRKGYKLVADLPPDNPPKFVSAISDAAQAWAAKYPEIAAGGELEHLLAVDPVEINGELVQVQVTLWINDQELAEDLFSNLRERCPGRTRVWRALPTLEETRGEAIAVRLKSVN